MTTNQPTTGKHNPANDFVATREFNAPRELVWKMWTDPKYLVHRVAPPGFTATVLKTDVSTGGSFHIVMRSTEMEFHVTGSYLEVIPLQRVTYTLVRSQTPDPDPSTKPVVQDVTFDELPGKTRVTLSIRFDSASERDAMLQSGGDKAMSASLDRVADMLAKLQSS